MIKLSIKIDDKTTYGNLIQVFIGSKYYRYAYSKYLIVYLKVFTDGRSIPRCDYSGCTKYEFFDIEKDSRSIIVYWK